MDWRILGPPDVFAEAAAPRLVDAPGAGVQAVW